MARFLLVGVLNTAFSYALFAILVVSRVPAQLALCTATVISVLFNFQTIGRLVFKGPGRNRLPRFIGAYAVSYGFNAALLALFTKLLGLTPIYGQLVCIIPTVSLTYVLLRNFVFAERQAHTRTHPHD